MARLTDTLDRRTALAGLAAGAAGALAACARPTDGATLRVAVFRGGVETFMAAAGEAAAAYRVRTAEFAAGNLITEAIIAGAIDLGSMSEIPPIFVARAARSIRLISVLRGDVNSQVVLVPHRSPIAGPAQLAGRRVGYVRATTSHYLLIRLLAEHGLSFRDITPVALSPQDGRTAFENGGLDAWVAYGVQAAEARARVGARVLATGLGRLSGNYLYAASTTALADPARRAAIVDYLARAQRTWRWTEANPAAWADLAARATGAPAAFYLQERAERSAATTLAVVDAAAVASQQAVADGFAQAGVVAGHIDVSPLWDRSLNGQLSALWSPPIPQGA